MKARPWLIANTLIGLLVMACQVADADERERPNVVLIVLDEWGYYETSHQGHPELLTPNIDRFAADGMHMTQMMAGAPLCGPTRATIMLGQHTGHTSMRSNDGYAPIRADDVTLATLLQEAGYATAGFGKWGIGGRGTSGEPTDHGFDLFYGYYDQRHAHTYYPTYLIRNGEEVPQPGNTGDFYEGDSHAQLVLHEAAMEWLGRQGKDQPFFLYLPYTVPHGLWGFPEDDPSWELFRDQPWTAGQQTDSDARVYAAMMHLVDRQVAELRARLGGLGLAEDTLILLTGDNGGQDYFPIEGRPRGFFAPNVEPTTGQAWRGQKGQLYEGGLRIPAYAVWPGHIEPGSSSDHLGYFPDLMPTFSELAGARLPAMTDGISFVPTLTGEGEQGEHDYLYWESGEQRAVRRSGWKAVRPGGDAAWQLYDLAEDPSETDDLADDHPGVLALLQTMAEEAHRPERRGEIYDEALARRDHTVPVNH